MAPRFLIPAAFHRVEELIKRSRFITSAAHASDSTTARDFVTHIKTEFPDATHNCWAFVAGPPGSTAHIGQSDDGEPHGTAGKPMLNTLLHSDVGEVVMVVTRYYDGIKLGTGGLVRAYAGMVKLCLDSLSCTEKVERLTLQTILAYEHLDAVRRLLADFEAVVVEEHFTADACLLLTLPEEHLDHFTRAILDVTNGLALLDVLPQTPTR